VNLNKVFILGNVTRDPETKALPSGQSLTSFGIATNRFYTANSGEKKQDVEFHNVVAFGRLADIASRYLTKGSLLLVEGRLKTRNWQDAAGAKRSRTEIIAENIQLAPKSTAKSSSFGSMNSETARKDEIPVIEEDYEPPSPPQSEKKKEPKEKQKSQPENKEGSEDEIDVSQIPF